MIPGDKRRLLYCVWMGHCLLFRNFPHSPPLFSWDIRMEGAEEDREGMLNKLSRMSGERYDADRRKDERPLPPSVEWSIVVQFERMLD